LFCLTNDWPFPYRANPTLPSTLAYPRLFNKPLPPLSQSFFARFHTFPHGIFIFVFFLYFSGHRFYLFPPQLVFRCRQLQVLPVFDVMCFMTSEFFFLREVRTLLVFFSLLAPPYLKPGPVIRSVPVPCAFDATPPCSSFFDFPLRGVVFFLTFLDLFK